MDNSKLIDQKMAELAELIKAGQAKKAPAISFRAMAQARREKANKYANAIGINRQKKTENLLIAAGYARGMKNDETGVSTWGTKSKPGIQLKIEGNFFSVMHGSEVKQVRTSLEFLDTYLSKK